MSSPLIKKDNMLTQVPITLVFNDCEIILEDAQIGLFNLDVEHIKVSMSWQKSISDYLIKVANNESCLMTQNVAQFLKIVKPIINSNAIKKMITLTDGHFIEVPWNEQLDDIKRQMVSFIRGCDKVDVNDSIQTVEFRLSISNNSAMRQVGKFLKMCMSEPLCHKNYKQMFDTTDPNNYLVVEYFDECFSV